MHNGRAAQARHARRDRERRAKCRRSTWERGTDARISTPAEGRARPRQPARAAIEKLDVYYGRAHALQEVSLTLDRGVLAVVGRNGMGKTTLCNAITGLVRASGSVRLVRRGDPRPAAERDHRAGVGYVPQGRRVWPSLTVDEHLRLAGRDREARGRSSASTRRSRAWPSASATAAPSSRAASSRCSRSRARCCSTRACW